MDDLIVMLRMARQRGSPWARPGSIDDLTLLAGEENWGWSYLKNWVQLLIWT
jgi:hypothetical protein